MLNYLVYGKPTIVYSKQSRHKKDYNIGSTRAFGEKDIAEVSTYTFIKMVEREENETVAL